MLTRRLSEWRHTILAICLLVGGYALAPLPADPDVPARAAQLLGAFLIFLFFAHGVVTAGLGLARLAGIERPGALEGLALGTCAAALVAGLAGHLGWIGAGHQLSAILALVAGPVFCDGLKLADGLKPALAPAGRGSAARIERLMRLLPAGLVTFALASQLARAFLPNANTDPLWYGLVAPRIWSDAGRITVPAGNPLALLASYWEYLFLWGHALLARPGGAGLIELLLFGQWTHVLLGYGGCALALHRILSASGRASSWTGVALLAALGSGLSSWMIWTAKNDWGVAFWVLAGIAFASSQGNDEGASSRARGRERDLVLAGALFGFAAGAKITALLSIAGFLVAFFVERLAYSARKPRAAPAPGARALLLAAAAGLAAAAPIFIRNALLTGNGFFPVFDHWFPSPLLTDAGRDIYGYRLALEAGGRWAFVRDGLALLARREPLALGQLLLAVIHLPRLLRARASLLALAPLATLSLFFALVHLPRGNDELDLALRYLTPMFALASGLLVLELGAHVDGWSRFKRVVPARLALFSLVTVLAAWWMQIPAGIWLDVLASANPAEIIRRISTGGEAKAWLRLNATPSDRILTTGDSQIYLISSLDVSVATLDPRYAALVDLTDFDRLVCRLRQSGVRYVLDTIHFKGGWWSHLSILVNSGVNDHPEAVAFKGTDAQVIDVARLPLVKCR